MATLTKDNRTGGFLIQWHENKRRLAISLGGRKYSRKTAERIKEMVETLISYRHNGTVVPDKAVANWLQALPSELRSKLAKVGLIAVHEQKTCKKLWDAFFKHKKDVKYNTIQCCQNSEKRFFETFSPTEPIESLTYYFLSPAGQIPLSE